MARALSASILAELAKPNVQVAILVEMDFASGWVRVWSGIGTLTYGGNPYSGIGYLGDIAPIVESAASVRANALGLTLSGVPSSLLAIALDEVYQGRKIIVHLAFFSSAWALLDAAVVFKGRMDTMQIEEGPETSRITLTAESHLADLKRPRVRRYTDADQRETYPDDRAFEYIEALQNAEIAWGPGSGTGMFSGIPIITSATGGGGTAGSGMGDGGTGGLGDQGAPDPGGDPPT